MCFPLYFSEHLFAARQFFRGIGIMQKKIVALILAAAMALGGTQIAGATNYAEQISEAESQKSEAQSNLEDINAQIADIETQQDELQIQIDDLDADLVQTLIDIDTTKADIEQATLKLAQAQTQLTMARATEEEQLLSMKERICYMYENGDASFLTAMVGADSFAQVLNKLEAFSSVYNSDRDMLNEFQETKQQVEDLVDEVAEEEADLEYFELTLEEQQAQLEEEIANKSQEMADFDEKLKEAEALAQQYQETITALNAKIAELQEAQRIEEEEKAAAEAAAAEAAAAAAAAQTGSTNVSYSGTGSSVASYACQFVGNPYVWGGTSLTSGCDCSGFIMSVYAHFGVSLPHSSDALRSVGTGVSPSNIMPGDIVCYSGHCAIYIGNGQIVHASNSKPYPAGGIKISNNYAYRTVLAVRRVFT